MNGTATAGTSTRERHCEKHNGRLYFEMWLPSLEHWAGSCDLCSEDERLDAQAKAILASRSAEKRNRIEARYKPDEKQIERETEEIIEQRAQKIVDEMETHRFEFEAEVRRRHWEAAEAEVESEMVGEIIAQLQKGKT